MRERKLDNSLKHYGSHGIPYYSGHEPEYDQADAVVVWYDDLYDLHQNYLKIRGALAQLVGGDDKATLEQMELVIRSQPAPAEDKAAALDAIHILLRTLP